MSMPKSRSWNLFKSKTSPAVEAADIEASYPYHYFYSGEEPISPRAGDSRICGEVVLTGAQAVVSPRKNSPLVMAITPPRNHGEVVLADDIERRREENFGWVGASAYTVSNVPPGTAQAKPSPVRTSSSVRFDTSAVEQVVRTAQTRTPPPPEPLNTSAENTNGPGVEEDFDSIRPSVPPSQTNRETPYQSLPAMTMANDTEFYHDFLRNEETAAPIVTFSAMALQQHDTGFVLPKIDITRDIADENFGNSRSAVYINPNPEEPKVLELSPDVATMGVTEEFQYRNEVRELQNTTPESKSSRRFFCCF